jgi:hypothetical protein
LCKCSAQTLLQIILSLADALQARPCKCTNPNLLPALRWLGEKVVKPPVSSALAASHARAGPGRQRTALALLPLRSGCFAIPARHSLAQRSGGALAEEIAA